MFRVPFFFFPISSYCSDFSSAICGLKILRIIINLSVNFVLSLLLWGTYLLMILPLFLTKIRVILNIFSSFRLYIEDFSFNSNVF